MINTEKIDIKKNNVEFCSKELQQKYLQEILGLLKNKKEKYGDLFKEYLKIVKILEQMSLAFLSFEDSKLEETKNELSNLILNFSYSKKQLIDIKGLLERHNILDIMYIKNFIEEFNVKDVTQDMMEGTLELVKFFMEEADRRTKNFKTKKEFDDLYEKINHNENKNKSDQTIIIGILCIVLFSSLLGFYKFYYTNKIFLKSKKSLLQ